ncbi:MAG: tetratricopeptide repeat protein [Planctomycetota bacterium]|nr:tetratricopeptide repeat protein [Planctomycetota bacterium]
MSATDEAAQAGLAAVEFAKLQKTVEDMMAVADYDRAEAAVESMIERLGVTEETKAFADSVRSEASAFREEQRGRMLAEVRQYAESRQWRRALDAARELVSEHPRSRQAEEVRPTILLLEENARIEEVRELRDRVADLIERKRFAEAVEVAEDLIHRFPDTQVAGQLTREIDKLRKRAGMNDLL